MASIFPLSCFFNMTFIFFLTIYYGNGTISFACNYSVARETNFQDAL